MEHPAPCEFEPVCRLWPASCFIFGHAYIHGQPVPTTIHITQRIP